MAIARSIPASIVATAMTIATPAVAAPPSEPETPTEVRETPTDELPSWNEAPPAPESGPSEPFDPPEQRPPDGKGRFVVGWMLVAGGSILAATSSVLIYEDDPLQSGIWVGGASLGAIAVAAGLPTLIVGAVRGRRYEPWQQRHGAPPAGTGMLAGGVTAMLAGTVGIILGGVSATRQDTADLPYAQVLLPLGGCSLASGVALTVLGSKRRKHFDQWERATFAAVPTVNVLRTPQLQPAGATFGVAGRF